MTSSVVSSRKSTAHRDGSATLDTTGVVTFDFITVDWITVDRVVAAAEGARACRRVAPICAQVDEYAS
ncbi:MAG: hypothetical protein ACKO3L_06480, partial [Actinomycetota bacterium]